ncbi:MAG: hypothetical protein H6631_09005 [Anaerolineaceae bacterium]|nr:hypothetical protein [Anaerolineaceae bacterium]
MNGPYWYAQFIADNRATPPAPPSAKSPATNPTSALYHGCRQPHLLD